MPVQGMPSCAVCGRVIEPEPELGDRQGGLRQIVHMASTWELYLCSTCVKPIFDLYERYIEGVILTGTAAGMEQVQYLPRVDDEGPAGEAGPSADGHRQLATLTPPSFTAEE